MFGFSAFETAISEDKSIHVTYSKNGFFPSKVEFEIFLEVIVSISTVFFNYINYYNSVFFFGRIRFLYFFCIYYEDLLFKLVCKVKFDFDILQT